MTELDGLLRNADAALYAAKAGGRDRCVAHGPSREPAHGPASGRRPAIRTRVLKAGWLSLEGGRTRVDCTVRSLSDEGAGLKVMDAGVIPETFELVIEADHFSRPCHVVLRADGHLDVAFR